jgi:hypothetical protein
MAKSFFYVCAGLFLLAGAYAFGARNAVAQAPGNSVVATFDASHEIITANGDIYVPSSGMCGTYYKCSNVFAGGPTPAKQESFGGVKARYR